MRQAPRFESTEWLEANGLGGYASGTYSGSNSRRYHGLLVAALHPPLGRRVLLQKLDEALIVDGQRYELADSRFVGVEPQAAEHWVAGFGRDFFPWVEFQVGVRRLRKRVAALHGENSTLVQYELLGGEGPLDMQLRPLLAPRDHHGLAQANAALRWEHQFDAGRLRLQPYSDLAEFFVHVPGAAFQSKPEWWYRFLYQEEAERGLDCLEDLFCYGQFQVRLQPDRPLYVCVSTQDPRPRDLAALWQAETARRRALVPAGCAQDPLLGPLHLAADSFLVQRGAGMGTVIAGYHWFGDWGRDTMISLRGLCHATGRWAESKAILAAFLGAMDQGLLPNRFPDDGAAPEYNTVDATLWAFVAVHDHWQKSGDPAFALERCLPKLLESLDWHRRGTHYGIGVDADGLLSAGADGVQLTWMDAKVGDWVVTPRRGKAVEVNALWYNALRISQDLCRAAGRADESVALGREADACRAAFARVFWDPTRGACFDVVGQDGPDASLRPNQLLALSLPFPLVEGEAARSLLAVVTDKLLTPRGLRTLSPDDPRYAPLYHGGVAQRDGAYHQGTVWPWLLGPYIEALSRVEGTAGRARARALLAAFKPHLDEAGRGSVSEIFDGMAPHAPRGCVAQAWSVAELLRMGLALRGLD